MSFQVSLILLTSGRYFPTETLNPFSSLLYPVYASYLFFHFCSHTHLYTHEGDEGGDIANSIVYSPIGSYHFLSHHRKNKDIESLDITSGSKENNDSTPESELETPQMKVWTTICLLIVVTVVSYFRIHMLH